MHEVSHLHGQPLGYNVAISKLYIDSITSGKFGVDNSGQRCRGFASEGPGSLNLHWRIT